LTNSRRFVICLPALLAQCLILPLACSAQTGVTRIDVSSTVIRSGVKRFGMNLGELTFYDSGQMMKNLVFRNPGFEGMIYRSVMRCGSGTPQGCVDEQPYTGWPDGFWNGARFEIIWGAAKGRVGIIAEFRQNSTAYTFSDAGAQPAPGDYILLSKEFHGGVTEGWWPSVGGAGAITSEMSDLPPATTGRQCARLQALAPGSEAALHSFFDSTQDRAFIRLNGRYRISFHAKGLGGSRQLWLHAKRGANQFVNDVLTLTPNWVRYAVEFSASEGTSPQGTAQLTLAANSSEILIDNVSLEKIDSDPANTTVFRDEVVAALKEFRPGILRHWAGQLGDTLDNQIAPPFGRQRSGYSANSARREEIIYDLEEFLQLCYAVGAEPWYVVPVAFSTEEAAGLIQYLAGSASTPYGARRAARGRALPWTEVFPKIHLEFGNESWNSVFKGGAIEWPTPYGARAGEVFGAMRRAPEFIPAKFNLVIGGQAVYVDRNRQIAVAAREFDSLSLAPYLMNEVNSFSTNEDLFAPLFAEPQQVVGSGYMRQNADMLKGVSPNARLSAYEVNLHTLGGAAPQDRLDALTPSLGAGLAVAEHMLLMLRDLGVMDQMLFKLPQFKHSRPDGKEVRLWGSVVDMGVTNRRRPQFLALKLVNEALAGDMLRTTHSAPDPTWNQSLKNGVEMAGAKYLLSFGFQNGLSRRLVLFNLHRTAALSVGFSGQNAPSGVVSIRRLGGADITANNETAQTVSLTQESTRINSGTTLSLAPYSITVIGWETKR
jgi:hypothetical protein